MHLSRVKKASFLSLSFAKGNHASWHGISMPEWLAVTHAQLKMNQTTVLAEFKDYPTFTDRHNLIPTMDKKWKCNRLPSLPETN